MKLARQDGRVQGKLPSPSLHSPEFPESGEEEDGLRAQDILEEIFRKPLRRCASVQAHDRITPYDVQMWAGSFCTGVDRGDENRRRQTLSHTPVYLNALTGAACTS